MSALFKVCGFVGERSMIASTAILPYLMKHILARSYLHFVILIHLKSYYFKNCLRSTPNLAMDTITENNEDFLGCISFFPSRIHSQGSSEFKGHMIANSL